MIIIIIFYIIEYFLFKIELKKKSYNSELKFLLNELLNFTSYSQFYEDLILFCIFYDVKDGFYIDVGANDPNHISVTKAFYLRGWYGVNLEPLPDKYKLLLRERKRDLNLQVGVGNKKGNCSLFLRGTGSTLIKRKKNSKKLNINVDTLSNICKKYIPKKKKIHFCKIDVEGGERNVLLGHDFENYRPEVFCIESTKPGTNIPCYDLWEEILLKNNYSFAFKYRINRYYIDNGVEGLRGRFYQINKYIKFYRLLNK